MNKGLQRIRGAIGMGLTWAVGWAIAGVMIGVSSVVLPFLPWHLFFEVFDAPLPALAVPGFFGGAFFSIVLGIGGRRRRFDELSLPRFAAWGALGGVLLSLFPWMLVTVGLASVEGGRADLLPMTLAISGPLVVLSTASASVTLLVARRAAQRALGTGSTWADELPGGGPREYLGR